MKTFSWFMVGISLAFFASPTRANIVSTSGDVKLIDPPTDANTGRLESDNHIHVFGELTDVELPQSITLDISKPGTSPKLTPRVGRKGKPKRPALDKNLSPRTLPAGKVVNSYYVHCDTVGENKRVISGSVTFDEKVLGMIIMSDGLIPTNAILGVEGTQYCGGIAQSVEMYRNTAITLSPDRRTVSFTLAVENAADNMRIITDASVVAKEVRSRPEKMPKPSKARRNKEESPPPAADLLPAPSRWSGTRTSSLRGKLHNCQIRVDRDGDLYAITYTEHHSSIRVVMYFKLKTDGHLVYQDYKNNSVRDISIHNLQANGSTNGRGMQIGYQWLQSGDGYQNALVKGSIDVTLDP